MTRRSVLVALFVAALFVPSTAFAQEETDLRFYIVPVEGGVTTPITPKYFGDAWGILAFSAIKYGPQHMLVAASLTQAQHDFIASQSDAFAIPGLDLQVGGNPTLNQVRNRLAGLGIPGSWIVATTPWRQVVKRTGNSALLIARMRGELGRHIYDNGVGLNTTLTVSLRDEFIAVANSLATSQGITILTGGITTSITVQTALLTIGDQLKPFILAGEVF